MGNCRRMGYFRVGQALTSPKNVNSFLGIWRWEEYLANPDSKAVDIFDRRRFVSPMAAMVMIIKIY